MVSKKFVVCESAKEKSRGIEECEPTKYIISEEHKVNVKY